MKRMTTISILAMLTVGCGGSMSGIDPNHLVPGSYSGTIDQGSTGSAILELTVANDGTITGKSTLVSKTSAAIIGRATLTGVSNSIGGFTLSGTYSFFLPPPPDTTWYGPVTVTGKIPDPGASTPVQLVNGGVTYSGTISSTG